MSQLFPAAPRSAPPRATACCERRATLCDATEGRHHMFAVRLSGLRTSYILYSQALRARLCRASRASAAKYPPLCSSRGRRRQPLQPAPACTSVLYDVAQPMLYDSLAVSPYPQERPSSACAFRVPNWEAHLTAPDVPCKAPQTHHCIPWSSMQGEAWSLPLKLCFLQPAVLGMQSCSFTGKSHEGRSPCSGLCSSKSQPG